MAKQNIVTLKERALWNGHVLVTEHEKQGDTDRVQALLAAKRKAHGALPIARIMCMSNLIIGYREGRGYPRDRCNLVAKPVSYKSHGKNEHQTICKSCSS